MSALKTQENDNDVIAFINEVEHATRREDSLTVLELITEITQCKAKMWGASIIGFGRYHYKNTGKGGTWPLTGLSPRKQALTVYVMPGFSQYESILGRLGKYKLGKSCLYIKNLKDIDLAVLAELIEQSIVDMQAMHECELD